MRNTVFLAMGLILLIIKANLHRVLGRIPIAGLQPNLILPLIVFMGVHEYSVLRGAALAFVLGYSFDLFAGAPIGVFTFVFTSVFVLSRAAGVRLAAQTIPTQLALATAFTLFESIIILMLLAIFGKNPYSPRALTALVLPHALATAAVSPLVFRIAERIHQATISVPRTEGGGTR